MRARHLRQNLTSERNIAAQREAPTHTCKCNNLACKCTEPRGHRQYGRALAPDPSGGQNAPNVGLTAWVVIRSEGMQQRNAVKKRRPFVFTTSTKQLVGGGMGNIARALPFNIVN